MRADTISIDLPERDPTKTNAQQGLYDKFRIERTDGSSAPGGKHHGCDYFVLDVTHDKHAIAALAAYADAVAATHPQLAADMRARWGISAPEPTADERVVEHMAHVAVVAFNVRHHCSDSITLKASFEAVEQSARALLVAAQDDAEHAAMYRWWRAAAVEGLPDFEGMWTAETSEEFDAAIRAAMKEME